MFSGPFPFLRCVRPSGLDFYGCVKLVNYVRTEVSSASGGVLKDVAAGIEAAVVTSKGGAFADER